MALQHVDRLCCPARMGGLDRSACPAGLCPGPGFRVSPGRPSSRACRVAVGEAAGGDRRAIFGILHVPKGGCRWRDARAECGPPTQGAPLHPRHERGRGGRSSKIHAMTDGQGRPVAFARPRERCRNHHGHPGLGNVGGLRLGAGLRRVRRGPVRGGLRRAEASMRRVSLDMFLPFNLQSAEDILRIFKQIWRF